MRMDERSTRRTCNRERKSLGWERYVGEVNRSLSVGMFLSLAKEILLNITRQPFRLWAGALLVHGNLPITKNQYEQWKTLETIFRCLSAFWFSFFDFCCDALYVEGHTRWILPLLDDLLLAHFVAPANNHYAVSISRCVACTHTLTDLLTNYIFTTWTWRRVRFEKAEHWL